MRPPSRYLILATRLALVVFCLTTAILPRPAVAAEATSDLRLAILVTRHGVRSPIYGDDVLGKYSADAWPKWNVPVGYLTPHGGKQMELMGAYYLARFRAEGILTGDSKVDGARVYFRADSDQRTIRTAEYIAEGLLPGAKIDPHARALDTVDPMYRAAMLPIGPPDYDRAIANVLGRIGGSVAPLNEACSRDLDRVRFILLGTDGPVPPGKTDLRDQPSLVERGTRDHTVNLRGPIRTAMQVIDNLMLEYGEGMPMDQVGWGRVTRKELTELLRLHSLYFELTQGSPYSAQVQGSNLASHILKTLRQSATGRPDPGAFGSPEHRVVMLVGHDSNIVNLGGLLNLNWWVPGSQRNPVTLGGAMVFELRQRRSDQKFVVRTYYVTQSLDQIRNLEPLSPENPPGLAPIFIPGCSDPVPGFDAPLEKFEEVLNRAIDPAFVLADPN
ncbi:MAG: histidine-type phosphatase [Verrucomicrobia bacterium]|nr:histidine-type phosphatase [Verrucomicrobiota bacterium]